MHFGLEVLPPRHRCGGEAVGIRGRADVQVVLGVPNRARHSDIAHKPSITTVDAVPVVIVRCVVKWTGIPQRRLSLLKRGAVLGKRRHVCGVEGSIVREAAI